MTPTERFARTCLDGIRKAGSAAVAAALLCTAAAPSRAAVPGAPNPAFANEKILVVSAHPDDDVLSASGVVQRAKDGGVPVKVVYVTNGDLTGGVPTGLTRQAEAVAAQGVLGVPESDLVFLGYPDGGLWVLRTVYTNPGDRFTAASGQSETYGNRGLGGVDYHTYRSGVPGAYNGFNLRSDLADLIGTFRPTHIVTLAEWDQHPDHTATYLFVSEAVGNVYTQDPTFVPTLHTTLVWNDQPSQTPVWPTERDAEASFTEPPILAATNLVWSDRESLDVPLVMQSTNYATNPKNQAIDQHVSQGGSVLFFGRFVHKDEFFWTANILGPNQPPVPNAGTDQLVGHGALVQIHGSASVDPEGQPLVYSWRQIAGPEVALSSAAAADPTFLAPVSRQSAVLAFELQVSDGEFVSLPDMTVVRTRGAVNVAPLSSASGSSENQATGQTATKAVDGFPTGYPVDYTREWATEGEGAGAWIELLWPRPYCIDEAVLYDRPNLTDRILAGTLLFSDASIVPVGDLDDAGATTEVPFPARVVDGVRFTVDLVSPTTENVGLAELEMYRCVLADLDDDDWLTVEGDCDDSDPLRNPGRVETPYDGRDNDCDAATPDNDLDGDAWLFPDDCDDLDPFVNPAQTEIPYNGKDEDCNTATPDNDLDGDGFGNQTDCDDVDPFVYRIPGEVSSLRVSRTGATAQVTWTSQASNAGPATVYDVVTGRRSELRGDAGFGQASCLGSVSIATIEDPRVDPMDGDGYYYLARGENGCGVGTYGSSAGVPDARDLLDGEPLCGGERATTVPRDDKPSKVGALSTAVAP